MNKANCFLKKQEAVSDYVQDNLKQCVDLDRMQTAQRCTTMLHRESWQRSSKLTLMLVVAVFQILCLLGIAMFSPFSAGGHQIYPFIANDRDPMCSTQKWRPRAAAADTENFRPLTAENVNGTPCILAFSAYFDVRLKRIEILTDADEACYNVSATGQSETLCLVWYHNSGDPYTSYLRFSYIATHNPHRSPRVGVVYSCEINGSNRITPYAVSVLSAKERCKRMASVTTLHISYPRGKQHTFVVCTPPIFGNIRSLEIVQFIEIHRLLGAELFYFYNASISADLSEVLDGYVKEGLVKVIQWRSFYPTKVFYNNQGIMQIDCLYRSMFKVKYVAQLDIDEVLMPRGIFKSWKELVDDRFTNNTAMLVFRNRYYTTDTTVLCAFLNATDVSSNLLPSYMRRLKYYNMSFKPYERSKILYSPERVLRIWTHSATPYQGYKTVVLEPNEGILHHYRYSSLATNGSLLDRRMCDVVEALYDRVRRRLPFVG